MARRSLNFRLLLLLVGGALALGIGIFLLNRFQVGRSARGLLQQAERAEARKDTAKAAEYLGRYLGYEPDDNAVRTRYAKLLASDELVTSGPAFERAQAALQAAIAREPGKTELRRQLAELQVKWGHVQGAIRGALAQLKALLGDTGDDDLGEPKTRDGRLEYLRGLCHEALGKGEAAQVWYRRALADAPGEIEAYVGLARLLRREGKADEADLLMDARGVKDGLVAHNPDKFRAYLARAEYRKVAKLPGVKEDTEKALSLAPDEADTRLAAARLALDEGKGDRAEARGLLTKAIELHPGDVRLYQTLAAVEKASGKPKQAIEWLKKGMESAPGDLHTQLILANELLDQGELDQAEALLKNMHAAGIGPESLLYPDARLLFSRGQMVDAARLLERSIPNLHESLTELKRLNYLLLAECYSRLGDADRRHSALRRASEVLSPGSTTELAIRLGLGSALAAQDRIDEAIDEYRRAIKLPGAPASARLTLARLLAVRTRRQPESQRQWGEVERALDDADRASPGDLDVMLARAEILAIRSRGDEAMKLLRSAKDKFPDRPETWVALAGMEQMRGDSARALAILDEATKALGDRFPLRLARVRYWGARRGPEAVEALARIEKESGGLSINERRQLTQAVAEAYVRQGELKRARPLWDRLIAEIPNNPLLHSMAFDLALRDDDPKGAAEAVERIRAIEPDGASWRYARAALLIWQAERGDAQALDEARPLLNEVAQRRPNWSNVPKARGAIEDLRKNPAGALDQYLAAIELGDRDAETIRRAADLLKDRGRIAEADLILRKLQDQPDASNDVHRLAAEAALRARDFDRALEQARLAVASGAKDYRNHLWLGEILAAVSQRERAAGRLEQAETTRVEAEAALRRAVELSPTAPDARVSLVGFLAANGRRDQALLAVAEAEKAFAAKPNRLALARCYELAGSAEKAATLYAEALKEAPGDVATLRAVAIFDIRHNRIPDAEARLRDLEKMEEQAPADAAWAKRTLALMMASDRDNRRSLRALEVLGGGTTPGSKVQSLADRRTRANVLALQKNRTMRREAIGLLEEIDREKKSETADLIMLAQLYEVDGDWPKARESWRRVLEAVGDSPQHQVRFIRSLLQHDELDEARALLSKLEASSPRAPATIELKARTLARGGKGAEAAKVVTDFLGNDNQLAGAFAPLLEQLGQHDAAEALYRRALKAPNAGPPAVMQLAGFLGRRGRVSQALDLLDSPAMKAVPAQSATNARVVILYGAKSGDSAQFDRVERVIAQAIKEHPGEDSLRFDLANLRVLQGRYDDAEAIFRQIQKKNPNSAAPLNNLAWLLALRGRGDEAQGLIQQAIEINGEVPDLLDTRALVAIAKGEAAPAIKDLEDAIVLNASPESYFHLAQAYRLAGKTKESGEALGKARDLGLVVESLHPLERQVFLKLNNAQAQR